MTTDQKARQVFSNCCHCGCKLTANYGNGLCLKCMGVTRKNFLKLPMRERRRILRAQADALLEVMPNYPEDL